MSNLFCSRGKNVLQYIHVHIVRTFVVVQLQREGTYNYIRNIADFRVLLIIQKQE